METKIKVLVVSGWLFFSVIVPIPSLANAENGASPSSNTSQGDDIPLIDENTEQKIDEAHDYYSQLLLDAVNYVDYFFDDKRYKAEANTTRLNLRLGMAYSKNDDFEVIPRVDFRLNLPRLEGKTQLLFTGGTDEDFGDLDNPLLGNDPEQEDYAVGLRHFMTQEESMNFSVQGGYSNQFFAGVRFRGLTNLGDWNVRLTDRLRYFADDKFENITGLDFETYWGHEWMFRATTGVVLSEREEGVPHGQGFRLVQVLNEYRALSYEANIYLDTEPDYTMTDAQLILRMRQRFFRDWLILEVAPWVNFPDEYDNDANPGIFVQLEASFGASKYPKGEYQKIFE